MNWKAMMAEQEDFLRPLIQEVVQQVLEAEMDEALGAEKGERTPNRVGYRSGHYGRMPISPMSCSAAKPTHVEADTHVSSLRRARRSGKRAFSNPQMSLKSLFDSNAE